MARQNLGISVGADAQIVTEDTGSGNVNVAIITDVTGTRNLNISAAGAADVGVVGGSVGLLAGVAHIGSVNVDNGAGAAAVNIQDGGNSITVDVSGTVTVAGTVDVTELNPQEAMTDNRGNPTTSLIAAYNMIFDGTTWDRMPGTSADGTLVNLGANNDVTVAQLPAALVGGRLDVNNGAWLGSTAPTVGSKTSANSIPVVIASDQGAVAVTPAANSSVNLNQVGGTGVVTGGIAGSQGVGGLAAADAATSGNPVLAGGQAETMADSAPGTRVSADGDAVKAAMTDGAQYVVTTGPQTWSYHENSSSTLTDTTVHAAPGAGLSLYVQTIVISLGAATAFNAFFEEGGTTVLGPYYLEAVNGRTLVINFTCPKKITANTALTVTTSAAVAHSIDITGFVAPG